MKKIDKKKDLKILKKELEKLKEQKAVLINEEKEYLEVIQDKCEHPLYLGISFRKLSNLDIVTIKCLECELEVKYLRDMLPSFEDKTPKVILWGNKRLNSALKFKIAQDEFRKFALSQPCKVTEEQSKKFILGFGKSCNRKGEK